MIWSKIMSVAQILHGHVDKECYWGLRPSPQCRFLILITLSVVKDEIENLLHWVSGLWIGVLRDSKRVRTPLGEWWALRGDLHLTTHNTHKTDRHSSPQRDSNLWAATGIGAFAFIFTVNTYVPCRVYRLYPRGCSELTEICTEKS